LSVSRGYKKLLDECPSLRTWYQNQRNGSLSTAEIRLQRIGYACKLLETAPLKLDAFTNNEAKEFIIKLVAVLQVSNVRQSYIENCVDAVKSWFQFNGLDIPQRIRVKTTDTKYDDEIIPNQEELARILDSANQREKAAVGLVAFSGIRIEVLGNIDGTDGLKVQDIPDLVIDGKLVHFARIPAMITVRRTLSKAGIKYFTFLSEEGCRYLKDYLEYRLRLGFEKELTLQSPIITAGLSQRSYIGEHISTRKASDAIRRPMRAAGFKWRPYVLRRYFDTRMMNAESAKLIIKDFRVFWMGHKGDIEHTYTLNKKLSDDIIDRMRASYSKAAAGYLESTRQDHRTRVAAFRSELNRSALLAAGYAEKEIALGSINFANISAEQLANLVYEKVREQDKSTSLRQKVVYLGDLRQYLTEGWQVVGRLPGEKAVIKKE
jgi:hypothetical protein